MFVSKNSNSDIDSALIRFFSGSMLLGYITNDPIPELRGKIEDGFLNFLSGVPNLSILDSLRFKKFLDIKPKEFFVLDL